MASITFSEQEIKKLILALAGSKGVEVEEPESEDMPEDSEEKMDEPEEKDDSEEKIDEKGEGKPFKDESTKDMLVRKMKEKGSK